MDASLFSLVSTEDPELIFAWGMEVVRHAPDNKQYRKAVVYIVDPAGQDTVSTHTCAESACTRWSTVTPLTLTWETTPQWPSSDIRPGHRLQ